MKKKSTEYQVKVLLLEEEASAFKIYAVKMKLTMSDILRKFILSKIK